MVVTCVHIKHLIVHLKHDYAPAENICKDDNRWYVLRCIRCWNTLLVEHLVA